MIWFHVWDTAREFMSVKLTEPLIPQKKYNVEFYVSLSDSCYYATSNIGAYFSVDSFPFPVWSLSFIMSKTPQVKYSGSEFLTDTAGWMKVEGSFTADGGEQFITIGNFDSDENTDSLLVRSGTPNINWNGSAYYVDDVYVGVDTTVGIEEFEEIKFEIYPNPAKEKLTVELAEGSGQNTAIKFFDVTGREVLTYWITTRKESIDVSGFAEGVYTAVLMEDEGVVARKKIIIE